MSRCERHKKVGVDLCSGCLYEENLRLKKELRENAAFAYNHAILATPTGKLRNKLTELNILRLQVLKGERDER